MPVRSFIRTWSRLECADDIHDNVEDLTCTYRTSDGKPFVLKVGDRIDVKWPDGNTSGHTVVYMPGGINMGVVVQYRGVAAYTSLTEGIALRVIPPAKTYKGRGQPTKLPPLVVP